MMRILSVEMQGSHHGKEGGWILNELWDYPAEAGVQRAGATGVSAFGLVWEYAIYTEVLEELTDLKVRRGWAGGQSDGRGWDSTV